MYDYKRKIMRFVIYERDLIKLIFFVENLFWVMIIEFFCLRKVLVWLLDLINKCFNLRLW